jgi:L-lactate dehydrogenase complex protein LldF
MTVFGDRRRISLAEVPDWQGLRNRARAIKDEVLLNLDHYLVAFAARAEEAGATVHWARDAAEACAIVIRVAEERGIRSVVKSKSMATEEIHLNAALIARGIDPVETDLGEYIIQLAGETPSHVVAPAIHKSKRQVAELFTEMLGTEPTDDENVLTQIARRTLRQRFAEAGMGITGVNFGVAETGSILILENEGNARFTSSVPPVHLAVMGIEKLIPRFADLEVMLKVLPRAGSGQQITSYQSLITGVKRLPEDEGPRELHIVLFDNGRSRMLAHPITRQSLACIRCGACLNVCPVFQQVGGHAYGSVYPGPIGAVITPQLTGLSDTSQLPYASSLCGACRDACPVKIDIPELLLHLRAAVVEGGTIATRAAGMDDPPPRSRAERFAFRAYAAVMARPRLMEWGGRIGRFAQRTLRRADGPIGEQVGLAAKVAPALGAWTAWRDLRPLAPRSFRELWNDSLSEAPAPTTDGEDVV